MGDLPKDRIDSIPIRPEHLKSMVISHPASWPEENRIWVSQEVWDELVAKYNEEKVGRYYRIRANGQ